VLQVKMKKPNEENLYRTHVAVYWILPISHQSCISSSIDTISIVGGELKHRKQIDRCSCWNKSANVWRKCSLFFKWGQKSWRKLRNYCVCSLYQHFILKLDFQRYLSKSMTTKNREKQFFLFTNIQLNTDTWLIYHSVMERSNPTRFKQHL